MNLLKNDKERATALKLSVTPEFNILFSYAPIKDNIEHELGLAHHQVHFCFLVSFLLQTTRVKFY